ncbi:MAG: hypothetical protein LBT00_14335 [Spirochaetaceae bacterium]|jgi:hypothetical protein|nr:hypothetical protein [Spirochaetaceae bacterium]
MGKTITLRVDDTVYNTLKRAAETGGQFLTSLNTRRLIEAVPKLQFWNSLVFVINIE